MNKKIIGAILCVCIITIGVVPAMGITEAPKLNNDKLTPDNHSFEADDNQEEPPVEEGEVELTLSIKRGLGRGVVITIENTGEVNATNVNFSYLVHRRGLLFRRSMAGQVGNFSKIEPGAKEEVKLKPFGFWLMKVKVKVEADDMDPIEKSVNGFVIFRFTRLRRFL